MGERPRVLYHHRTRAFDGQAVHIREMLRAFEKMGVPYREVALVAQGEAAESEEGAGGILRKLKLPRTAVECLEVLYSSKGAKMLSQAALEFGPDLIYERHALHCEAGLRAARRMGVPLFLEVNSPMVGEMDALGLLKFPKRARRSERRVLEGADRIFVVTRVLGDILEGAGADPAKIVVTPNGADLAAFEGAAEAGREFRRAQGIPESAFVMGFVGFPRTWHRLDRVLDAWKRLGDLARESHLLIVGDGPAVAPLLDQARQLGFEHRILVTGPLPRAALKGPVGAFDLALIPAINSYASPLKLLDSLAAGIPTLVPDQPNLHEHVRPGEHALFFDPKVSDSFVQSLRQALEDVDALRNLGERGRQHLLDSGMTWEANARRVCEEWKKLGGGR